MNTDALQQDNTQEKRPYETPSSESIFEIVAIVILTHICCICDMTRVHILNVALGFLTK